MKSKKKLFFVIGSIVVVILIAILIFFLSLRPVSRSYDEVIFEINRGTSTKEIIGNLKEADLIKSKYITLGYMKLTNKTSIQAGSYKLSRSMSTNEILDVLTNGDAIINATKITFKEGMTLKDYLKLISEKTDLVYDDILDEINNPEFLKKLISDYWFLEDNILDEDIYYALEGYLFPNTYQFYKDANLETVIRKMLDETNKRLNEYKQKLEDSNFSIHDIITMASIAEKEANSYEERQKVAQVIFKRLDLNMSLGMDVTSYYGVGKSMQDTITTADLNDDNPYNTRLVTFKGLPVGPICNPGIDSIKAILNPADTDYVYFYADKNGTLHFTASKEEFDSFKLIYG